ncbi:MAG: helix-hairpin-helix domain-containing protein, partial [Aggregatilineales bacterium]
APRSPAPVVIASSNGNGAATAVATPPAPAKEAVAVKETTSESDDPDDLTKVEGIGPKMSRALIAAGIETFEKLAAASDDDLRQAIEAAEMRFAPSLVTWAEQAEFAAKGDWDGLQTLQDTLKGGRRE